MPRVNGRMCAESRGLIARPGLECRTQHAHGWPGGGGRPPYRRAGGNRVLAKGAKRLGTDRLYERVRQGTRHSGWMNEASPAFEAGECQILSNGSMLHNFAMCESIDVDLLH